MQAWALFLNRSYACQNAATVKETPFSAEDGDAIFDFRITA